MSSNLPLGRRSRRVLPYLLILFMYGRGGHKLEINIPRSKFVQIVKGELKIEGGVMSSEYGKNKISPSRF